MQSKHRRKLETDRTPHDSSHISFSASKFTVKSCTLFNSDSLNGKVYEMHEEI